MINPIRAFNPFLSLIHLQDNQLRQIYAGVALRDFAMSTVGVFEPIYLYLFFKNSTSFTPLSAVSFYYALLFIFFGAFSPVGAFLASKIGFRWVAIASMPFRVGYYIILSLLPHFPFLLPLGLISVITGAVLYWPGFHFFFAHASSRGTRANAVSLMTIAGSSASAIGPAIGGIIIVLFGYPVLFTIALLLLFASTFPFWFSKDVKEVYQEAVWDSIRDLFKNLFWRVTIAFSASGAEDQANGIFWPLFLFLLAINYSSLGFIISLSLIITLIATYLIGRISDRVGWLNILRLGIFFHAFAWVIRIFVTNSFRAFIAHGFFGITRAAVSIPFSAIFYDDVAVSNGKSYWAVIIREQALNLGRGAFLLAAAVFFLSSDNFFPIFFAAAAASLLKGIIRPSG